MPKKNPFRLRLYKLAHPTPRRIYCFRRRVKRLRAYLLLYVFPQKPPPLPPIDTLYKKASMLRQAYLIRKATKDFSPVLPPGFTNPLGRGRDYYIFHKWLAEKAVSIHWQSKASRKYEQKAFEVWQNWRLLWA